jgi:hypothetical protein
MEHPIMPQYFQAELWTVQKDSIHAAITELTVALDYVKSFRNFKQLENLPDDCLRTIDARIRSMERALEMLKNEPTIEN